VRSTLKRSTALIFLIAAAVLAAPAAAEAKTVKGTVLSLDRHHHKTRVILPGHNVRSFHYKGRLGRKVHVGSRISANLRGRTLRHVRSAGRSRVLKFYGRVVRNGRRGLVLRLGDGQRLTLGGKRRTHHRASVVKAAGSPVSISIQGLQP